MNSIWQSLQTPQPQLILGLAAACFLLCGWCLTLTMTLRKMSKRMDAFFGSKSDRRALETMLATNLEAVAHVSGKYEELLALIDHLNERMQYTLQHVGVVRFNPFDGMGGDLSFAVALLDQGQNGVVISTIHGRDASYTYAKPVLQGESTYALTAEERRAIAVAMSENKLITAFHET